MTNVELFTQPIATKATTENMKKATSAALKNNRPKKQCKERTQSLDDSPDESVSMMSLESDEVIIIYYWQCFDPGW